MFYLKVLMVNVPSQARRATKRVAVRPFCRWQMPREYGQVLAARSELTHAHLSSVRAWNARLRLADSKTMKARSRKMRDILALCERRPSGLEVYSS